MRLFFLPVLAPQSDKRDFFPPSFCFALRDRYIAGMGKTGLFHTGTISMKLARIHQGGIMDFYSADLCTELALPFAETGIAAGFPSPADDFMELSLDLNRALVQHPAATFYARVKGTSMTDAGIEDGDLLVIDKSLDPKDGDIAVCFLDGEFTVKRIACRAEGLFLVPANDEFRPIRITEENDFLVWGVVTYIIHKAR